MTPTLLFISLSISAVLILPCLKGKWLGIVTFLSLLANSLLTGYYAWQALLGGSFELILPGSLVTGEIPLRIDALSGWFLLTIHFTFLTGCLYGLFYMKAYADRHRELRLHAVSFVWLHASLVSLCVIQNSIVFLIAWEIMAFTSFLTIIFEQEKITTIKAGVNFLIQSHVSVLFLILGFIWVVQQSGSYDFSAIRTYTSQHGGAAGIFLFLCFFAGFSVKAGFIPFHTWLPHAHPAAPSHISGIMSGVIIKIGIYGILRMILLIRADYLALGYIILLVSVLSGLYGVMLAIRQHNLKRLLAYHSIENIGIIGIGMGVACIGLGTDQPLIASLGFAGAMLHVLNHSLFKSLLFYTAGIVYQTTHTLNLESLGGLIKKLPQTASLFLLAAIAICGVPPLNGFISEFLIYLGLYHWLQNALLVNLIVIIFTILGLVLIGGLAILCFTKAFGVVFLGEARCQLHHTVREAPFLQLLPLYLIAALILAIGLLPQFFLSILSGPVSLFLQDRIEEGVGPFQGKAFDALQSVSWAVFSFLALLTLMILLRSYLMRRRKVVVDSTWGCGYVAPTAKLQYTASSFVRTYAKLFHVLFLSWRSVREVQGVFPTGGRYASHPGDGLEQWLIDKPVRFLRSFLGKFLFLQNGKLQFYILYGILFIVSVLYLPFFLEKLARLLQFFKQL